MNLKNPVTRFFVSCLLILLIFAIIRSLASGGDESVVQEPEVDKFRLEQSVNCAEAQLRSEYTVTEFSRADADAWEVLVQENKGDWFVTGPFVGNNLSTNYTCQVKFTNDEATTCDTKCVVLDLM